MLQSQNDRLHFSSQTLTSLVALGSLFVAGCSKEQGPVNPANGSNAAVESGDSGASTASASGQTATSSSGKSRQRGRDELYEDEKGQKWFGQVPYDVFFDKPLEVARDTTPVGGGTSKLAGTSNPAGDSGAGTNVASTDAGTATTPMAENGTAEANPTDTSSNNSTTSETPAATAGGGDGWKDLISVSVIDTEVKNIRNFFNETLQTVGSFNSSMLMLPPKAASLAVMAGVAMEHPDNVSWKEDAIYVRDLAKKMNASTLQRGAKDQKRLLELFEAISETLNRSRPAGLEEPNASDSFPEVAEMRFVMARMDEAEKRMRTEAGSQGAFQSGKEMVKHEAAILATLTHTVAMPGYGYGDDEKFVGYAKNVVDAARTILSAAEADDFATYELALSKVSTNCNACHSEYKND